GVQARRNRNSLPTWAMSLAAKLGDAELLLEASTGATRGSASPSPKRLSSCTVGASALSRRWTRARLSARTRRSRRRLSMSKSMLVVEDQEDLRAIRRDFLSASGYIAIEVTQRGRSRRCPALQQFRSLRSVQPPDAIAT